MDGVGAGELGDPDHLVDREIAFDRPEILGEVGTAADLVGLVSLEPVQGILVLLRPDGHRFDAKLIGGTEYADRDL